jgi:hypothetical protein
LITNRDRIITVGPGPRNLRNQHSEETVEHGTLGTDNPGPSVRFELLSRWRLTLPGNGAGASASVWHNKLDLLAVLQGSYSARDMVRPSDAVQKQPNLVEGTPYAS